MTDLTGQLTTATLNGGWVPGMKTVMLLAVKTRKRWLDSFDPSIVILILAGFC